MIKSVMQGKDEGADHSSSDEGGATGGRISGGIKGRVSSLAVYSFPDCIKKNISDSNSLTSRQVSRGGSHVLCARACFLRQSQRYGDIRSMVGLGEVIFADALDCIHIDLRL